jgi:DNA-directed RNA polymerase specialized sigma subunit
MVASLPSTDQQNRLEDEYADAFHAWQQSPTPRTNSELLAAIDPVIRQGLKTYGGVSAGSPSLRSKARQIALRSFRSYNPSRGSLRTHLMGQLRGLQRAGAREAQIIRLPEQVALDRQHLEETEEELRVQLGREPSTQQLANAIGLSLRRIAYIRQANPAVATGTILAGAPARMPASTLPGQDQFEVGWQELVYHDLSDTDQVVFDHLLGAHGKQRLTTTKIAQQLGITPSAVSQRADRIQRKLDERWTVGVF